MLVSLREIARHLGWGLHTVQRYARAATWQELADGRWQRPRPGKLDAFKPYLDQHAGEGHGSITRLFREIQALGYDGSYHIVRAYLNHRHARAPLPQPPPTVRDVTSWLTRHPDSLTGDEQPRLNAILGRCPELQAASGQVRAFAAMMAQLTGQDLPQWIAGARDAALPGIASFARGARPRSAHICSHVAACSCRPNTGHFSLSTTVPLKPSPKSVVAPREHHHLSRFHVTFKMIKRQMYGRAGLPLLRKRVLLTAQHRPPPQPSRN